jgi:hypothetical protein
MTIDVVLQLLIVLALLIRESVSLLRQERRQGGFERLLRKARPQTRLICRDARQGWTIEVVVGQPTRKPSKRRTMRARTWPEDGTRA